ncbi:hypothetical protein RB195_007810 [Necator americanus]|uniref:Uncharacterized protein n=1 Tax=Necator americanus TaxID=51031 RepID=A0ABR1C063_NECAM
MEYVVLLIIQFFFFLFLFVNCTRKQKGDHKSPTSDVSSDRVGIEHVEKKESLTTARPSTDEQSRLSANTEMKGKVTKIKLRDLADEPSLSRSKLQGSSDLQDSEKVDSRPDSKEESTQSSKKEPQTKPHESQDKIIDVNQTAQAALPIMDGTEPTQNPESNEIEKKTEETPLSSVTERTTGPSTSVLGTTSDTQTLNTMTQNTQAEHHDSAPPSL